MQVQKYRTMTISLEKLITTKSKYFLQYDASFEQNSQNNSLFMYLYLATTMTSSQTVKCQNGIKTKCCR